MGKQLGQDRIEWKGLKRTTTGDTHRCGNICSHWRNKFKTKFNKIVSELSIEVVFV